MMTKTQRIGAAAALATVVAAAPGLAAEPIKVGEINSYTALAEFTQPYRKGWEMAVDEINDGGGLLGRRIQVIARDDDGKPANAVKIAEEMVTKEKVDLLAGTFFSHIGLAVSSFAKQRKVLFVAAEPLTDDITWAQGNDYTFRLRPGTYVQSAMLATEAAKNKAKRWAIVAPNYKYGQDAVAAFKTVLKEKRPDVEFVTEQWPALGKIDPGATVQALAQARPEAIYVVLFGADLGSFVREYQTRGLFKDALFVGLLSGEPEYLDPLGKEAPEGWIVTGYPWYAIDNPAHKRFVDDYRKRYNDYPRLGSLIGYLTLQTVAAAVRKAGSTDRDALIAAMKGLTFDTPVGRLSYRALDHQSTLGAWVGRTAIRNGKPVMVDFVYADPARYTPSEAEIRKMRGGN